MKKAARSFGYAFSGFVHAIRSERNLRFFSFGHIALLCIGMIVRVDLLSLIIATFAASLFIVTELLNTAIERLADTVDDCEKTRLGGHFHIGIKQTKDVASAASLIMLTMYGCTIMLIALPYILFLLLPLR